MKVKEKLNGNEQVEVQKRQQNGTIKKKKKRDNFEVKIPRIIVRNLGFKVGVQSSIDFYLIFCLSC